MSRGIREFVETSGIRIETTGPRRSPSLRWPPPRSAPNVQVPREVELNLLKRQEVPNTLQRNIVNDRRYEGMFKEFENDPLENEFSDINENAFKNALGKTSFNNTSLDYIAPTRLSMSKLNIGMFNANVNSGFGKEARINIKNILVKKPLDKTFIGEGLYIDTLDIKGIYGRFQTGYSHSKNYGPKGNINKDYFSTQIILRISNGIESHKVTFNIYKNGKIRFSAGFVGENIGVQPELIRKFVIDKYTERESFLYNPFEYNNISAQFKFNGVFRSLGLAAARFREYGMTNVTYEPELGPFFYAYIDDHKYNITKTGNVQILGGKSPQDILNAYNRGQRLIEKMNDAGEIKITGVFSEGDKKTRTKPKAKPKAKAKTTKKKILNTTQISALNINSKRCERMPRPELVDLAKKMGVVGKFGTRKEICEKIKKLNKKKTVTFKNTTKGKNVAITGKVNTKNFRIGRKICDQYSKPNLELICKAMKIPYDKKDTKLSLCKKIEKARNNIAAKPVVKPPSPRAIKQKQKNAKNAINAMNRQLKINNIEMKRRLNENSIRNDLAKYFGVTWMKRYKPNLNNDVKVVQNEINKLNKKKNALGIPFKRDINEIKRRLVSQWKMQRKRNLEKKYIMNNTNVTGVPYNLKNNFKLALANYILNNKKGKISKKGIDDYRKYWLKFRSNINNNARPKGINRAVRARIETL